MRAALLCLALLSAWSGLAQAHKPSDSYLTLARSERGVVGHWDIAVRDLDYALGLDSDHSGTLTWRELRTSLPRIARYASAGLAFADAQARCSEAVAASEVAIVQHSDGAYARLPVASTCASALQRLHYTLLFDLDAQHRAIVQIGSDTSVLSKRAATLDFESAPGSSFTTLLQHGAQHIFAGVDHLLFLLALLLPALLTARRAQSASSLLSIAKVVTAFTVAHSITLALSALGVVTMQARVIEPAIAVTVGLAAALNLRGSAVEQRASLAFALGLLHGFGFSSALGDLGLRGAPLVRALCAFNLGVELGQLAVVLAFIPLAWLVSRSERSALFLRVGSLAIVALSLFWFVERIQPS